MPLFDEFLDHVPPSDLSDPKIKKSISIFDDLLDPEDLEQRILEASKPVAVILFWVESHCACGSTSGGPRYGAYPYIKRWHKKTKTWHYEPLASLELFPLLPRRVDVHTAKTSHCPSCFSPPVAGMNACKNPAIDAGEQTEFHLLFSGDESHDCS